MVYSNSVIAVPPGATIKEQLETRNMTQKEFACRMALSEKHVSHLINGKAELTQEVALRLEAVFGIPAGFWNNLEAIYRENIVRAEMENALEEDAEIAKKMPYLEISKLGWVPKARNCKEKAQFLRQYFEVARLELLCNLRIPGIAYRRMAVGEKSDYALAVWAQKARIEARKINTAPINLYSLEESIPAIRSMTTQNPSVFCGKLIEVFAQCGVALVFLPHIGGSFLHGASFHDGNKIVMGLTVRGRDADRFWFSLFHEMCHILCGHIDSCDNATEEQEEEADAFARDVLIPQSKYQALLKRPLSAQTITAFAAEIGVDPGIVVGRLQKEGLIQFNWNNDLKTKYRIQC